MSQYSDEWLERVRQKDSIIENNVDGGLHQLVRNLAGELLEKRRNYREMRETEGIEDWLWPDAVVFSIAALALFALVTLSGCGAGWQNAQDSYYLKSHPFVQGCVLQRGVDPGALQACTQAGIYKGANALMRCSGENWIPVQECMIASKESDQIVSSYAAPGNTAVDLEMIQLGAQLMQGPPRVIVDGP